MSIVLPLLIGLGFGALLERAGLTRHERIVGVFRLRDLTVLQFLLTAIVVGAVVVQAALSLGLAPRVPVTTTRMLANAVGGGLFGIGMAGAGFCTGTILAGAGSGRLDALPALLGLLTGALLFGLVQPGLPAALWRAGARGAVTLPVLLGVSPWLLLVLLWECTLLGLYAVERRIWLRAGFTARAAQAPHGRPAS